ncbi:1,4-alpha-glucan branching protein GlgB [Bailinhaonella thermotolerans]|uniref:1,4-alpha-glucan branching protein GlgB n=1 Tax=Bailinhaonella thermotolerans TaxID=1070861 RepID=UPI001F5BB212|nr:1,4-alpha-glucan branching protein GlgB [Bailinhaonella thermotolerans]
MNTEEIDRLVGGAHHDPHSILGAHPGPGGIVVRALRPLATSVEVIVGEHAYPMKHVHNGVFEATVPGEKVPDYRLRVTYEGAEPHETDDPYRHWPTLGEVDLHLIGEGRHEELWKVLGAHAHEGGTAFAVWAPNARGVRVVGDFNHWDGTGFPMRSLGSSGVWELYVPGVGDGARYKFQILGPDGTWRTKADPMAQATEHPPATASVVFTSSYAWGDGAWMDRRASRTPISEPMSVYEVHLGSWRPGLSYLELADQLVEYVRDMGFTHVELLPVAEHPFGGSWGYQVTSYYAPTSRFGNPDEFRHLVDRLHQAGVGVLLDWVPAHFPMDDWALARFDGTPLYEHADPARGEHPDWGTFVFDYGRREVRNFLVANAVFWLEEFHIDGLRVDAVASMLYLDYSRREGEWTPNVYGGRENLDAVSFLQEMNSVCYRRAPGIITVAEESTAWPGVTRPVHLGGLGFGFKWNMGWMHDTLSYLRHEPIFRQYHHHELTFSLLYAFSENYVLPLSHDEVVHGKGSLLGKMPGDEWQRFAQLRALYAFMWAHPGKQLLFMGSEFGQGNEWSEERGLDWWVLDFDYHQGVRRLVRDLNRLYGETPSLYEVDNRPEGFRWIDADDARGNVISFLRLDAAGNPLACVVNLAGGPHEGYRLGLPLPGVWREVLNTDAYDYGGSGVGNLGAVEAVEEECHGLPYSVTMRVPPLGAVWLRPEPGAAAGTPGAAVEAEPIAQVPPPVVPVPPPVPPSG